MRPFCFESSWASVCSNRTPPGVSSTRKASSRPFFLRCSTASKTGSAMITMPGPPPYGGASTFLCLSLEKSRRLTRLIFTWPCSWARFRMLSPTTPENIEGKSVTTSMITCAPRNSGVHPPCGEPIEATEGAAIITIGFSGSSLFGPGGGSRAFLWTPPFFGERIPAMTITKMTRQIPKYAAIVTQGQASNHEILFLNKGTAVVEVQGSVVGTINTGEWFGELAAILKTPRTDTLRAVTPCEVQVFAGPGDDDLYQAISKDPKMLRKLVEQLCQRLIETSKRHAEETAEVTDQAMRMRRAISGTMG